MSNIKNQTVSDRNNVRILLPDEQPNNKRIAIRYVRTDITASLSIKKFLFYSSLIPVTLLDISSKGAAIKSKKKLAVKKKVTIHLLFLDKKKFTISATIVHKSKNKQFYGLKFDQFNNELGDYLLYSQSDLIFR